MTEAFARPAPFSVREPREGVVVGVEVLPRNCIEEVTVNPAARDLLPQSLKYLASRDYLVNSAVMSVPRTLTPNGILTPEIYGRAIPLAYGVVPFGDQVGRVISGKGTWLSGAWLRDLPGSREHILDSLSSHYGLLSMGGAQWDTEVSNTLLAGGFRSSLHLGFLTLNTDNLRQFLSSRWIGTEAIFEKTFGNLLRKKKGGPAYLFRVSGTTERIDDCLLSVARGAPGRQRTEISLAARLALGELENGHSFASTALQLIPRNSEAALSGLQKMRDRLQLNEIELNGYLHFWAAVCALNVQRLHRLLGNSGVAWDCRCLGLQKDTDLGFFTYDYDELERDLNEGPEIPVSDNVERYLFSVSLVFCQFLALLKNYGYLNDKDLHQVPFLANLSCGGSFFNDSRIKALIRSLAQLPA